MQAEMRQGHDVDAEHRHLPLVAGLHCDVGSHRVWSKGGMVQSSASHAPRLVLLSEDVQPTDGMVSPWTAACSYAGRAIGMTSRPVKCASERPHAAARRDGYAQPDTSALISIKVLTRVGPLCGQTVGFLYTYVG